MRKRGQTTITVSEPVKKRLVEFKESIGASTWDECFEKLIDKQDKPDSLECSIESFYYDSFSSTKAFFDGLFASLRENMDIIKELAEIIAKNLNPVPHAIAEFIRDVKNVFIEKWKKGELTEKDMIYLMQLSEMFANFMGSGISINASTIAAERTSDGRLRFVRKSVSLDQQDTNKQGGQQILAQDVKSNSY